MKIKKSVTTKSKQLLHSEIYFEQGIEVTQYLYLVINRCNNYVL